MYNKGNSKYNIIPKKILRKDVLAYVRFLTKVAVTSPGTPSWEVVKP